VIAEEDLQLIAEMRRQIRGDDAAAGLPGA
jgi:hypothetical protein